MADKEELLTQDGTGSPCMIWPEDRERMEREKMSNQDEMNDRDETDNREECEPLPHWANGDVWGPIVNGIRAGKSPTDILRDVCGHVGKGASGASTAAGTVKTAGASSTAAGTVKTAGASSTVAGTVKTARTPSNASPNLNTYPHGVKSKLFPNLLAVCEGDRTLDDVLQYVQKWCENWDAEIQKDSTKGRGYDKTVVIVTDKWDKNVFAPYEEEFRRRAMREDFWFTVYRGKGNGYTEITFPWSGVYDFTRHPTS